ncbi:type II and III secretion system protein family protein [Sphingomonas aestuarii]
MRMKHDIRRALAATVATAVALSVPGIAPAQNAPRARVGEPAGAQRPPQEVLLSVGEGELVTLPATVTSVWTSNPGVADVYVANPRQIHLFGKEFGEATIFATNAAGTVVYSSNVRVSQNLTSIDRMMRAAMPEADVKVTTVGQLAVLNGVVASPEASAEAERLATMLLNPGVNINDPEASLKIGVVNRLRIATPLQVNLHVRIAEVSRSFVKNIGVNVTTRDTTGGFNFGLFQGRQSGTISGPPGAPIFTYPTAPEIGSTIGAAGRLLGLDLLGSLDLGETQGQVSTLANPTLTALSGETATFLAGGEIPILIAQGLGAVSVEYKQYGVSLAYTPTVLADGRISLRVRPEVSQLSAAGAVTLGNNTIPGLVTRRAETTVELGSGESLVIGGLLQNNHDNSITKTPGLGDVPILGSLFRSNGFKRNETELVIVVTPYLVKPVNANQIVLPTDGYLAPTDLGRVFMGQLQSGDAKDRPKPSVMAPNAAPGVTGSALPLPSGPTLPPARQEARANPNRQAAAPGFSN